VAVARAAKCADYRLTSTQSSWKWTRGSKRGGDHVWAFDHSQPNFAGTSHEAFFFCAFTFAHRAHCAAANVATKSDREFAVRVSNSDQSWCSSPWSS
jgi:hypothetical protein